MKLRLMGLALVGLLGLAACDDDDDTSEPVEPTGRVRAIHLSPDAPAVDIKVDGAQVLANVSYLTASDYLDVPAGDRTFRVEAVGSDDAAIEATVPVAEDVDYTLIALNELAAIEPLYIVDDNTAPAAGTAKVRVIHGAPGVGPVDVYFAPEGAAFGEPSLTNFDFGDVSSLPVAGGGTTSYVQVPAGTYVVRVVPAGEPVGSFVIEQTIAVPANIVATAVAVLNANGGTTPGVQVYVDAEF